MNPVETFRQQDNTLDRKVSDGSMSIGRPVLLNSNLSESTSLLQPENPNHSALYLGVKKKGKGKKRREACLSDTSLPTQSPYHLTSGNKMISTSDLQSNGTKKQIAKTRKNLNISKSLREQDIELQPSSSKNKKMRRKMTKTTLVSFYDRHMWEKYMA